MSSEYIVLRSIVLSRDSSLYAIATFRTPYTGMSDRAFTSTTSCCIKVIFELFVIISVVFQLIRHDLLANHELVVKTFPNYDPPMLA